MKRLLSPIMIVLVLLSTLVLSLNIQPVKSEWTGTVYIRADGSIHPLDSPIRTYDKVTYILTNDITTFAKGIVVERDGIVIDGAGYTIRGAPNSNYYEVGIDLSNRVNVTIKNINIQQLDNGISLYYSSRCVIFGCNITDNENCGVSLAHSSDNTIIHNVIVNTLWYGISLLYSSNNTICRNNITDNKYAGIQFNHSTNNSITCNNILRNYENIYIFGRGTTNNRFWHNNFVKGQYQVGISYIFFDEVNIWDDGYPSGGNYWSDYKGVDEKSGSNQDQLGCDDIGDTPYIICTNNKDRYPLMKPYNIPSAPQTVYLLHVQSYPITGVEVSYSGDYSGTGKTNFDIGPMSSSFTVTLTAPFYWDNYKYRFSYWKLDGEVYSALKFGRSITVKVDNQNIERTVRAVYEPRHFELVWDVFSFSNKDFTKTVHLSLEEIEQRLRSNPIGPRGYQWFIAELIDLYQKFQDGYCGGMVLATKYYYENPDKLPKGYSALIEVPKEEVLSTIILHQHTCYFVDDYLLKWILLELGEEPGGLLPLEDHISWLKSELDKGNVVDITIVGYPEDNSGRHIHHVVLAYDYDEEGNAIALSVYGPNYPTSPQTIKLTYDQNGKIKIIGGKAELEGFKTSRIAIMGAPIAPDWNIVLQRALEKLVERIVEEVKKEWSNLVEYFSKRYETVFVIKLHSAAELHVYNSEGKHVGLKAGDIEIGFPSIFYVDEDGTENFILPSPNADNYKVLLVGKTNGHYNLTIFTIRNGALLSKIIKTGNISEGEKQEININISPSGEVKEQTKSPTNHYELWIIAGLIGAVTVLTIPIFIKIKRRRNIKHKKHLK